MGVAADTGHALESEIEQLGLETCFFQERHEEGAETAVDVEGDLALDGEF